jgi:hypothetical protein
MVALATLRFAAGKFLCKRPPKVKAKIRHSSRVSSVEAATSGTENISAYQFQRSEGNTSQYCRLMR